MGLLKIIVMLLNCCSLWAAPETFKFHLLGEPYHYDPALIRGSAGSYLYSNVFRSLFTYSTEKGLAPEGAEKCYWKKTVYYCELNKNVKWSDGSEVTAGDYIRAWQRLVNPNVKSVRSELLLNVKNAKEILNGKKPAETLGVTAPKPFLLKIEFEKVEIEFPYKLTYPAMAPLKVDSNLTRENAANIPSNGPYKVKSWVKSKRVILEPNPYYWRQDKNKTINVEVLFIDDDETARRMFLTGNLNFLRRLPTEYINQYKNKEGFFQTPLARFDYVGFGKEMMKWPNLRKAMSLALDYAELQKIYSALGIPGCPSLPKHFMNNVPCHNFNLAEARKAFAKVPKKVREKTWNFHFSKMGGTDIMRGMQWMQHQWKKNLGLRVELKPEEQGVYLRMLRQQPPDIFRKGIGVDRPTCLAAIEIFEPGNPENFLNLDNKEFNKTLDAMKSIEGNEKKKRLCSKAIDVLVSNHLLIPLGEIHFTMMHDNRFTNWNVNELNQLDLSRLAKAQ